MVGVRGGGIVAVGAGDVVATVAALEVIAVEDVVSRPLQSGVHPVLTKEDGDGVVLWGREWRHCRKLRHSGQVQLVNVDELMLNVLRCHLTY